MGLFNRRQKKAPRRLSGRGANPLNGRPYGLSSRGEVKHMDNILTL